MDKEQINAIIEEQRQTDWEEESEKEKLIIGDRQYGNLEDDEVDDDYLYESERDKKLMEEE